MKNVYNQADSFLLQHMLRSVVLTFRNRYIPYHGEWIFQEEYLLYSSHRLGPDDTLYDANLQSYNAGFAANPGVYEYILENLDLPEDHVDRLVVVNFEDHSRYFLKTDRHWNYRGSYQGHTDILQMLAPEEAQLWPLETVTLGTSSGSKAAGVGTYGFEEDFAVYRFAFPDMTVTTNNQPASDHGRQSVWLQRADKGLFATAEDGLRYGSFYGGDIGKVVFDTGRAGRENLLILGDSYNNATLKLLTSHFGRTYAVDPRHYEAENGVPFSLSEYIKAHDITKVLAVGRAASFHMSEFAWGGGASPWYSAV